MIEAFVRRLHRAELTPTHQDLADMLWLANFLPGPTEQANFLQQSSDMVRRSARDETKAPVSGVPSITERPEVPPPAQLSLSTPAAVRPRVPEGEVYPRVARLPAAAATRAAPIRVPAAKALPNALEIGRAMRPLSRRYPSRRLFVMDDEATVERIAEGGPMTPVMRPLRERWFGADVVVDASRSMVVWDRVIREFLDVLEQQGAFADVRRWTLTMAGMDIILRSPSGLARRPGELMDPTARRLIFVVTDGVGEAWRTRRLPRVLSAWARTTPVVIVQVLPERLWPYTTIGVPSAEVWSPVPGVANSVMLIERAGWDEGDPEHLIPIVPITLDATSIHRWARALMGAGRTAQAILFERDGMSAEQTAADLQSEPGTGGELSAEERVQRFRVMVSPEAYDLAVFLSAVPLTLPVIGLVQRELLPHTRQVHLAEVFVGGIVERVTPNDVVCDADSIEFDFHDGVRDVLQDSLRRSEAMDALVSLSKYVEKRFGQTLDFEALIADPKGVIELPEALRPFARLGLRTYMRFLGGHVSMVPVASADGSEQRWMSKVMPGKEYAIVIRAAESEEALCFVARPFSSDYDAIYDAIRIAAVRCLLKPCTTIDFRNDKDFTQKFFQTIASANLVIAVCSPVTNGRVILANDNVMYELGIAHTLGKKTVILASDSAHLPSDIKNRIFSKYSIHSADHQKNIETVERAIKTALAGAPEFLRDDIWIIDSTQLLFAKNQFWKCFSNTISQIEKLFLVFSSFEDIAVIPCRSQFNEMLRDPQKSLRTRQTFLDQWAGAARYYEQYIVPHMDNLNGMLHNFKKLLELSRGTPTEKIINEAEQVWHFLVNDITSCHNSVDSFKNLAIYRNIIIRYADNLDLLVEQFNNIDLYTHAVSQKTALLMSIFHKMFPGEIDRG